MLGTAGNLTLVDAEPAAQAYLFGAIAWLPAAH